MDKLFSSYGGRATSLESCSNSETSVYSSVCLQKPRLREVKHWSQGAQAGRAQRGPHGHAPGKRCSKHGASGGTEQAFFAFPSLMPPADLPYRSLSGGRRLPTFLSHRSQPGEGSPTPCKYTRRCCDQPPKPLIPNAIRLKSSQS